MVPVVLFTGFLGSGKTTLLNRLLAARPPGRGKMALVVNELGDVGIDGALLPAELTRQVELPGGCICCALDEDLEKTLLGLTAAEPGLETIVIETTGIAEPLPISWTLAREPVCAHVRLAAVVTVVDALEHEHNRSYGPSADAQVEYADVLVVSKIDLTPGGGAPTDLVDSLRALNPVAPVLTSPPAEVAEILWQALDDPPAEGESRRRGTSPPGGAGEHDHSIARHFGTVWVPIDDTLDFEELSALLEELPPEYVRIKGIARVVDASTGSTEPHIVAFHRVGARVSVEPIGDTARTGLVALGPGIRREPLTACIKAAVVP